MAITLILLVLSSYLLGSVPAAYLIARWRRGIDIRQYGSGNVGASNVLAVVSKRWGIPVIIFDMGKGALAVLVAQLLGLGASGQVAAGLVVILGHNWSVFLRFSGGRGMLTSLGVILMLSPSVGLIALVLTFLLAPFRQIPLGVSIALISLPVLSWFFSQPLGIDERLPVTLGYLAILSIAVLRRLTAPRTPVSASLATGELIVNRLLFDRDIRDRKAWISQTRTEAGLMKQRLEPEGDEESAD